MVGSDLYGIVKEASQPTPQPQVNPLLATAMQGVGAMAANGAAQKADDAKASAPAPEFRIKIDPKTGNPMVDAKNISMLDHDSTKEAAVAQPKAQVATLLQRWGYAPEQNDPGAIADQTSSFRGAYAASKELGNTRGAALMEAIGLKTGIANRDRFNQALQNQRTSSNSMMVQKYVEPLIDNEEDRATTAATTTNARRALLNQFLDQGVAGYGSEEEAAKAAEARLGGFQPGEREAIHAQFVKERAQSSQKRADSVNSFIKGLKVEDIAGYKKGEFERFAQDMDPDGQMAPGERSRLKARFNGLHDDVEAKRRDEDRKDQRLNAMWERIATATAEKPEKISMGDAKVLSADELISLRDEPGVDQKTLASRIRVKSADLDRQITTTTAKVQKAREQATAIKNKAYLETGDAEQLAGLNSDVNSLSATLADLRRQKDLLGGGSTAGGKTAPKTAPKTTPGAKVKVLSANEAMRKL